MMKMPTDRNSLAFLYMACARAEGVRPVFTAGQLTGLYGPQAAIARYQARMATLQPKPPHRLKRSVRTRLTKAAKQGGAR